MLIFAAVMLLLSALANVAGATTERRVRFKVANLVFGCLCAVAGIYLLSL